MTGNGPADPHVLPDPVDPETQLPPPRVREPGSGRQALLHWLVTVVGFTAMLLIGLLFTR